MANNPEFDKPLVDECIKELMGLPPDKVKELDLAGFKEILKKYDDNISETPFQQSSCSRIYEYYAKLSYVKSEDIKPDAPAEFILQQVKIPFVGDASYQFNRLKLMRGMPETTDPNAQTGNGFFGLNTNIPSAQNPLLGGDKTYFDVNATSKYYHPQDDDMTYFNYNIYPNKPNTDITNQQFQLMAKTGLQPNVNSSQINAGSMTNNPGNINPGFGTNPKAFPQPPTATNPQTGFGIIGSSRANNVPNFTPLLGPGVTQLQQAYNGSPFYDPKHFVQQFANMGLGNQPVPNMNSPGLNQPNFNSSGYPGLNNQPNNNPNPNIDPFMADYEKIMKLIDQSGGFQKTLPAIEKSLYENEMKHIDPQLKQAIYLQGPVMQPPPIVDKPVPLNPFAKNPLLNSPSRSGSNFYQPQQQDDRMTKKQSMEIIDSFGKSSIGSRDNSRERQTPTINKTFLQLRNLRLEKEDLLHGNVGPAQSQVIAPKKFSLALAGLVNFR